MICKAKRRRPQRICCDCKILPCYFDPRCRICDPSGEKLKPFDKTKLFPWYKLSEDIKITIIQLTCPDLF